MSVKAPSLFDDFFAEEEKKEELFPDIPHVYDPMQNKENEIKEQEPIIPGIAESEKETFEDSPELEIEEKKEEETTVEKSAPILEELNLKITKRPKLELPEQNELDQQLLHEIISSDYTSFIHKDYPFNPLEIEAVSSKKSNIKEDKQESFIDQEDIKAEEKNKNEQKSNDNDFEQEDTEEPAVIPLPEWNLTKKYYPIGEVAKLFDVNISHIRFWTNEFQLNPRTTRKGDRLYSPEQINELKLIHYLVKVKKHTIKGAKEKMKNQKETVGSNLKLKDSLTELRNLLVNIQNSL